MGLGFDWNGDGKQSTFDDLVTLHVLNESQKKSKKSGGGCGTCAISVLAVPALVIGIVLKAKGVL